MDRNAITIARAELTDGHSCGLVEALNAELRTAYSEPGATQFALESGEVAPGRGVFLIVSIDGAPAGCSARPAAARRGDGGAEADVRGSGSAGEGTRPGAW